MTPSEHISTWEAIQFRKRLKAAEKVKVKEKAKSQRKVRRNELLRSDWEVQPRDGPPRCVAGAAFETTEAIMVTINQVKYWHVIAGIGHVVATNHGDGWLDLACNTLCTGDVTEDRPARICRKCRERMKDAEPVKETGG